MIAEKVKQIIDKDKKHDKLDRINAYINNHYYERDDDAIFWNLNNSRITHFAKLLGVDTKDFLPYGIGEYNIFQAWALKKMIRKWFEDVSFYQILNDIAEGVATYGSVVWKKIKKDGQPYLEEVNLENIYFDHKAKNIKDVDVVELNTLSRQEIKDKSWNNIDKLLLAVPKDEDASVWEFTGHYEDKYQHIIGYGYGDDYIELWKDEIKDSLYYDFHLGKYKGTWLRVGVVERLFELQARVNQLVNQNAASTEIASLLLFKSSQGDVVGNVLQQAVNGQIIPSQDLEQLGISNTGLNAFISELQMIENQADKICLTPQILQGEGVPSVSTFRGLAVVNSSAKDAFTAYHQNLGEKIAHILLHDIFPKVIKKWNNVPFIEIAEDDTDVENYDKALLEIMKKDYLLSGEGNVITPEVEQEIQLKLTEDIKKIGRKIVPDKNWINFKWGIKMMPTNETINKSVMNDAYLNATQMVSANPGILDLPLFKQYLENNNILWTKLSPKQKQALQQPQQPQQPPIQKPDALLTQANL